MSHWSAANCSTRFRTCWAGRRPSLTAYQRNRPDFPLRVFVRCAKCGTALTGSWSTGRKKKYPYYRCRENCDAVKAQPDKLHAIFLEWLQKLAPKPESMEAMKDTVRTVWKERQGSARTAPSCAETQADGGRDEENHSGGSLARRKGPEQGIYDENIGRLTAEVESVRGELLGTELEAIELERVLDFAERIILRPERLWVESSLDQRQRLQKTLFPNGIDLTGRNLEPTQPPYFSVS